MNPAVRAPQQSVVRMCHVFAAVSVYCAFVTAAARAQDWQLDSQTRRAEVFNYVEPLAPNYLRAAVEEVGLLGLGLVHYMFNREANARDWDYQYDWPSFRQKLTGTGYKFDSNLFDTNFVTHPAAGTLYYWAARGNRMPVLASFAYAFAASLIWEMFGEFREHTSVNDLLVTPLSGLILGETTFQLGAFFDRSCASTTNAVLGSVFSPSKSLHDLIDGAKLDRDTHCDQFGFTQRGAHEFRLGLAAGMLTRLGGAAEPSEVATRLWLQSRLIALNSFAQAGEGVRTFSDGNVTELATDLGFAAAQLYDFELIASIVPVGLHYRKLQASGGADVTGYEVLFGLLLGTEYTQYRFAREQAGPMDKYFTLDVPGFSVTYLLHSAGYRLELELRAATTLAGIDAFALPEYRQRAELGALTTVAMRRGYDYSAGISLQPRLRFVTRRVELGAELKGTRLWAIRAFDRVPPSHVPVVDQRRRVDVWVRLTPAVAWPWRVSLLGRLLQREGSVAAFERSSTDLRVLAGVETSL